MEFNITQALEVLKQTPKTLQSLLSNLSNDWVYCNEGSNTWSAFDVVGHLIHCEKADWIPRLNIILGDADNKTFDSFDRFAQFENSKGKTMRNLLETFQQLRNKNLEYLKSLQLSDNELSLTGNHPAFGEVSAKELLATWTTHDLGHIVQIARVMAKQYKDEVGPWIEYISVLKH
jgi:uncharacterized damage-inducible protein DinB